MAKIRQNERTVIFIEDYSNKPKGLVMKCDAVMASHLINIGVATIHEEIAKETPVVIEPQSKEEIKTKTNKKTKTK